MSTATLDSKPPQALEISANMNWAQRVQHVSDALVRFSEERCTDNEQGLRHAILASARELPSLIKVCSREVSQLDALKAAGQLDTLRHWKDSIHAVSPSLAEEFARTVQPEIDMLQRHHQLITQEPQETYQAAVAARGQRSISALERYF